MGMARRGLSIGGVGRGAYKLRLHSSDEDWAAETMHVITMNQLPI